MTLAQCTSFALAAAVLTLLPGPDTVLVFRYTLRFGQRTGLLVSTGICAGLFVHGSVSALGMTALLHHSPAAFGGLQLAGAAYLAWLGVQSIKSAMRGSAMEPHLESQQSSDEPLPRPERVLLTGFFANVLNPKAMLFYAALLPQFLLPTDPVYITSIALTAIHWLEGMLWLGFLVWTIGKTRSTLLGPRSMRILEWATGILLCGFAVRMVLEHWKGGFFSL